MCGHSQTQCNENMFSNFRMTNAKTKDIPIHKNYKLIKSQWPQTDYEIRQMNNIPMSVLQVARYLLYGRCD